LKAAKRSFEGQFQAESGEKTGTLGQERSLDCGVYGGYGDREKKKNGANHQKNNHGEEKFEKPPHKQEIPSFTY